MVVVHMEELLTPELRSSSHGGFNIKDVKHMLALWRTNPLQLHGLYTIKDLELEAFFTLKLPFRKTSLGCSDSN